MSPKNLFLSFIFLISLSSSYWYFKQADKSMETIETIDYLQAAQSLIIATQKTRGLTNSYRNGNLSAQLLVYSEREAIHESLKTMLSLQQKANINPSLIQQQKAISDYIEDVNRDAFKKNPPMIFQDYTSIIQHTIHLAQQCEDHLVHINSAYKPNTTNIFPLIENIAKLRGLGSGCVARGHCNDDETGKLTSFITQITHLQKNIQSQPIFMAINHYTSLSHTEVITKKSISLNPDYYFNQGTAVIDDLVSYTNGLQNKQKNTIQREHTVQLTIAGSLSLFTLILIISLIMKKRKNTTD